MKNKVQREGYRVDLKHNFGFWLEYTALRKPETLEMCQALGRGLKRQGAGGRIVKVTGTERKAEDFISLVEEWESTGVQLTYCKHVVPDHGNKPKGAGK